MIRLPFRKRRRRSPPSLRFTRLGAAVVFMTLGVGFAGLNTGNNLLYMIFGMMLGFITASGFISEMGLWSLEPDWILPSGVHAGRPALLRFVLRNGKRKTPALGLEAEIVLESPGGPRTFPGARFLFVPAGGQRHADIAFTPERRGLYTVKEARVETRFPFGFFRKRLTLLIEDRFVVYPRVAPLEEAEHRRPAGEKQAASSARGPGDSFWGIRDFQEGDSPRAVSWKVTARQGRLMARETEKDVDRKAVLSLEPAAAWRELEGEALESAVSFAASLARQKQREGFAVGFRAPGFQREPSLDDKDLRAFFSFLALFDPREASEESPPRRGPAGPEETLDVLALWKENRTTSAGF
ncbi:MAG: DUF58 domain-containing protein [Elusimicrobiota bacterium]